ncbi:unnamed protein product [Scytosiphon promiscuus]
MTTWTFPPRESPAALPLQNVGESSLPTVRLKSPPRRSVRPGCWATVCALLLLIIAELPPALTASNIIGEAQISIDTVLPVVTKDATCVDWAAWIPPRSEPAIVMQVVSQAYIPIQQNFIRLMERNSAFNRHNLFLMCMDDASIAFFEEQMGITCVPMSSLHLPSHRDIWKLRVHVLSCLVRVGRVDVIMSDADALWVNDPAAELFNSRNSGRDGDHNSRSGGNGRMLSASDAFGQSGDGAWRQEQSAGGSNWLDIRDSDVVASRGSYPRILGKEWGATMCMGFVLFRAGNVASMATFLSFMEDLVMKTGDDQVSVNTAASKLGVVWDEDGDMRYEESTRYGVGHIPANSITAAAAAGYGANSSGGTGVAFEDGHEEVRPLTVTLLPHNTYTRICDQSPISDRTVVAHCYDPAKVASVKTFWMESMNLWSVENDP